MNVSIRPGIYTAYNQGMCISPLTCEVIVVWSNSVDVWYRYDNDDQIRQTPVERFKEIIRWKNEINS